MHRSTVRVKDAALIIDARTAKRPGVVRLSLRENPYLNFGVQSDEEGSHLGYTQSNGGAFQRAASFADRTEADRLLSATLKALTEPPLALKVGKRILLGVAIAIGLVAALMLLDGIFRQFNRSSQPQMPAIQLPIAEPTPAAPKPGTPADADSLLQPPN